MAKVRCKFCEFEFNSVCAKKKTHIKMNKKRSCSFYVDDKEKIMAYLQHRESFQRIPTTLRPDWMWDKAARRKEREKRKDEELKQYETTASNKDNLAQMPKNAAHPVTGDLSRFSRRGDK